MKKRTLAEIDQLYGSRNLPWVVQAWKADDTGVDPLGLRQVNLDMMDRLMPGINNVTRHVRVYTVMTWAWWKAGRVLSNDGERGVWSKQMRDFVDRVDAVFSWSQFMRDPEAPLPGSTVLPKRLNPQKDRIAYDFAGEDWERLRNSRRNSTDLLGAIQYGPSIRGTGGLRWLVASENLFVPANEVMPAIEEFDAKIASYLPRCLKDVSQTTLTHEELKIIGEKWDYRTPSDVERSVFAQRFFGNHAHEQMDVQLGRRQPTLRLMLEVLNNAGRPCSVDDVRGLMFGVGVPPSNDPDVESARKGWRILQLRQLQRFAIEALYIAIERRLISAGAAVTARIVGEIEEALTAAEINVGSDTDAMLTSALSGWDDDPDHAVFELLKALEEAQRSDDPTAIPALSIAAIACVQYLTINALKEGYAAGFMRDFDRQVDRLPLGEMLQRLEELGPRPATEALSEFVDAWVFGQHLRWSLVRSGDGQQRLRVGLDEGGWTVLRTVPSATFAATPDRLRSALRLCADSGMIATVGSDLWAAHAAP